MHWPLEGNVLSSRIGMMYLLSSVALLGSCAGADDTAEPGTPSYADADYAKRPMEPSVTPVDFTDVTEAAGIDFVHENGAFGQKWMPETMGSGGAFLDFDGDGWPDILLVNGTRWAGHRDGKGPGTPRLYRNLANGRFADVTREAGLDIELYGMGVSAADFDADDDLDIYLTAVGDNVLLRNDAGRFTDVTQSMGVTGNGERPGAPSAWSTASAWLDADRDGWLDLFVCNYVQWTPETDLFTTLDGVNKSYATPQHYQGESCRLYQNVNGKRFLDITERAGVLNHDGKALGVAMADFNRDGWLDLVVANDTYQNFLYLNNGDGTFADVALQAGVAFDESGRARAGMGVDVADVAGDGRLSIAIGNFSREPLSLYTQIADELFQDRAGAARLTRTSTLPLSFGVVFFDANLDGHADIVVGNGHIEPEINAVQQDITFAQPPQLFLNNGAGRFVDGSSQAGDPFIEPIVARGIATSDVDRDGDLDVLITVNAGAPKLLRNNLPTGDGGVNWLRVELRGDPPNRRAVGAHVTLYAGSRRQIQMVRTGSSYLSQSDTDFLIFGLGGATRVDSIHVRWPTSGRIEHFDGAEANRVLSLREGGGTSP